MIPPPHAYVYQAVVTRIVDGDTYQLSIDLGFHLSATLRVRLVDVNTPEGKAGRAATEHARARLEGREVLVHAYKGDGFGRWLGRIWLGDVNIGQELIDLGLAVPYRLGEGGV
jgi:micrococcal nuclease